MKRKNRHAPPPGTGYHPAGAPIDCYNELADPNEPLPPLIEYAVPLLDAATFAWLRETNPEEAERFLRANGPSAVG